MFLNTMDEYHKRSMPKDSFKLLDVRSSDFNSIWLRSGYLFCLSLVQTTRIRNRIIDIGNNQKQFNSVTMSNQICDLALRQTWKVATEYKFSFYNFCGWQLFCIVAIYYLLFFNINDYFFIYWLFHE